MAKLILVELHKDSVVSVVLLNDDVVTQQTREEGARFRQRLMQIDRLKRQDLLPSDGEELPDEALPFSRGVERLLELEANGGWVVGVFDRDPGTHLDDREQVVEVVRDTAGESSERLEPLGVGELYAQVLLYSQG